MNEAADGNIGSGASSGFAWSRPAFAQAVKPQACQLLFRSFSFWQRKRTPSNMNLPLPFDDRAALISKRNIAEFPKGHTP
ncbi:MAG: hypothetical protein IKD07_05660 [Clostridia bacterium]|nr:hypothetical protein [Clostridia bacterium]